MLLAAFALPFHILVNIHLVIFGLLQALHSTKLQLLWDPNHSTGSLKTCSYRSQLTGLAVWQLGYVETVSNSLGTSIREKVLNHSVVTAVDAGEGKITLAQIRMGVYTNMTNNCNNQQRFNNNKN